MRQGFVKAAAATPKIKVADPAFNAQAVCEQLKEAYAAGAKIIVFPELCLTGYTCGDLFWQDTLLEEAKEALVSVMAATAGHDALVFVGLPLEKDSKLYNVAAVVQNGKVLAFIPKKQLPDYAEFGEARYFTPGEGWAEDFWFEGTQVSFGRNILFSISGVNGLTVACEICEDLWAAEQTTSAHALAGANVIVNLSAVDAVVGRDAYRQKLLEVTSARLHLGYICAAAGEGESTQDLVFGGQNMIAENGRVIAQSKPFETGVLCTELDIQKLRFDRRRNSSFAAANNDEYEVISVAFTVEETALTRKFAQMPFIPQDPAERAKRCEEILTIQAYGLKKRMEHTFCKSAVVGVSGGLDSTLALLVTAKACDLLGIERSSILAVTMPCFGTTNRTYENACKMATTLGAVLREVNIKDAVNTHFRDIGQDPDKHDVTFENSQARERTQVLMDLANQIGGMVIGTGDMSELALGWATYNGDHMSMYGVNGSIPKTLVRHLVQHYADTCESKELAAVLLDVLDTPVSPELLPPVDGSISQKTEDLVGPYELHDFFLYYMLRFGFGPKKIFRMALYTFAGIYEEEVIRKWLKTFCRRFFTQQFKRSCLPDGPKVGTVGVSPRGDLRMPSDASMAAWQKELETI
ncbi:MAG: NAD(+) synthase [Lachnospiraceae bacterium]|nr:NAD(+) synthase [Lachnospiraceae bacterium]